MIDILDSYRQRRAREDAAADALFEKEEHIESWQRSDVILMQSFSFTSDRSEKEKNATDWMFERYGDENGYRELRFVERDDSVED